MGKIIKVEANPGESGSGTTLIEAYLNKKRAVGVELDNEYCEIAQKRISAELILFDNLY